MSKNTLAQIKKWSLAITLGIIFATGFFWILALWNAIPFSGDTIASISLTAFIIGGLSLLAYTIAALMEEESDNTNDKGKPLIG